MDVISAFGTMFENLEESNFNYVLKWFRGRTFCYTTLPMISLCLKNSLQMIHNASLCLKEYIFKPLAYIIFPMSLKPIFNLTGAKF